MSRLSLTVKRKCHQAESSSVLPSSLNGKNVLPVIIVAFQGWASPPQTNAPLEGGGDQVFFFNHTGNSFVFIQCQNSCY